MSGLIAPDHPRTAALEECSFILINFVIFASSWFYFTATGLSMLVDPAHVADDPAIQVGLQGAGNFPAD
jgi:hypothetical protein